MFNLAEQTATQFATAISFMINDPLNPEGEIPFPADAATYTANAYLASNVAYDRNREPFPVKAFNADKDITPDVDFFDPYNYHASVLALTAMSGLTIETSELDGITIPLPNVRTSLVANNSQLLSSAIPLRNIVYALPTVEDFALVLTKRSKNIDRAQRLYVSILDMSVNRLPVFDSTVTAAIPPRLPGYKYVPNICHLETMSNAGTMSHNSTVRPGKPFTRPDHSIYAWSSYRYVNPNLRATESILDRVSMFLTFRTIYGTNVTMMRTQHPSKLFPQF